MPALTNYDAKITSTRTTVGQLMGQFNGAMERYTWVRFAAKLTPCDRTHIAKVSIPVGRWNVTHGFDSQESSQTAKTDIAKVSIPQWGDGGNS